MAVLKEKQEVNNMEEEDRQRELDKREEKKRRRAQKAAENAALLEEAAAEEEHKAEARARIGALPFAARLRNSCHLSYLLWVSIFSLRECQRTTVRRTRSI